MKKKKLTINGKLKSPYFTWFQVLRKLTAKAHNLDNFGPIFKIFLCVYLRWKAAFKSHLLTSSLTLFGHNRLPKIAKNHRNGRTKTQCKIGLMEKYLLHHEIGCFPFSLQIRFVRCRLKCWKYLGLKNTIKRKWHEDTHSNCSILYYDQHEGNYKINNNIFT